MKKWMIGATIAAGLMAFGGAALAQDATPQDSRQAHNVQQEDRSDGHEGCRFGQGNSGGNEV